MNKAALIVLALGFYTITNAQTATTRYFANEWLGKEVSQKKALFSETVTNNIDGTVLTEIKDLTRDKIVRSETFKGDEPFGIWEYHGKFADYNFPVKYAQEKCSDSISLKLDNYFVDNDSLGYKAPKIKTGELSISHFIQKYIFYSERAKDKNLQGIVYVRFTLTKEGGVDNIFVTQGVNIILDKEAIRVIRKLQFSNPPILNGQPQSFCIKAPIQFKLE
ncbi:energy transducer TonB [Foetidibacter luteolus]|uniref:energy transducer TonB n=1 Tax=Foetidibacter luteolus TaxID=2608880 RepID=UPI00129A7628|nr:energy transducer TonB [Foetidibacter luteolus]